MATKIIHPMPVEGDGTSVESTGVAGTLIQSADIKLKPAMSEEDLRKEYDFYMAEKMSKLLLDKGLLTQEECDKLSIKNRETFSPYLCSIMAKSA